MAECIFTVHPAEHLYGCKIPQLRGSRLPRGYRAAVSSAESIQKRASRRSPDENPAPHFSQADFWPGIVSGSRHPGAIGVPAQTVNICDQPELF